ncbi:MAG: ROK family protein [Syntrophobacterales bacterium]|nr:ROK family protein [Syntrophobacterales bacterium]
MAKDTAVLALDLGGTNMRWALVSDTGRILKRWERATASMPDQEALLSTLVAEFLATAREAEKMGLDILAAGLGVPGRVLPEEGVVAFSPNVPALNACPVIPSLSPLLPWPLRLENDANLFALGEYWVGAGQGHPQMLGITLGTGVGGGLILNGRLWSGTAGTAGEIGHMTIDPDGKKCHCGNRGCLETLASGAWTVQYVKDQLAEGTPSWLSDLYEKDPAAIDGETLVVAARMSDPLALRAFERVGKALGVAIANVVHLLGLSRVVLGGRFSRAWDLFHLPLMEELYKRLTMFPPAAMSIVPARLGDEAGLIGAARLAWETVTPPEE